MTTWHEDILGVGFSYTTLELHPDEQGEAYATLIRYLPQEDQEAGERPDPAFAFIAIHGWNDYFYQTELARTITSLGGQFYAIDLRRYGRSHREGQLWGYVDDLSTYDEDLHAALDVIFDTHGYSIPLVMYGHSTGGLTAALWADRHPGALAGLILNSPWLEFQGSTLMRQIGQPLIDALAYLSPTTIIPTADNGFYQRVLTGWTDADGDMPPHTPGDPFFEGGWNPDDRYRHFPSFPVRAGWLSAVLAGHYRISEGLELDTPVLVVTSARSIAAEEWSDELRTGDAVLDVAQMWKRLPTLAQSVTLAKVDGAIHDVLFSRAEVRRVAYDHISRWIRGFIVGN